MGYFKLLLPLLLLTGCVSIENPFKGMFERKPRITIPPKYPEKLGVHKEEEQAVLATGIKFTEHARYLSTEKEVVNNLDHGLKLLKALRRSIGEPTEEMTLNLKAAEKLIKELNFSVSEYRRSEEYYKDTIQGIRDDLIAKDAVISGLQKENETLASKLNSFFWWAVGACVLAGLVSWAIAVFVPGGDLFVKRAWRKAGSLAMFASKGAFDACRELSQKLTEYAQNANTEERQKLKELLKGMDYKTRTYWDKVREGRDPVEEEMLNNPAVSNDKIKQLKNDMREFA